MGRVGSRTEVVSFHVPRELLVEVDRLVSAGVFVSRSEAIRVALLYLLGRCGDGGKCMS